MERVEREREKGGEGEGVERESRDGEERECFVLFLF